MILIFFFKKPIFFLTMEAIRIEFISNDMTGKNASTQGNLLKTFFEHLFTMNAGFTEHTW